MSVLRRFRIFILWGYRFPNVYLMMKISIHKDMVEMRKIRSNGLVYIEFSSSTTVKHFSIGDYTKHIPLWFCSYSRNESFIITSDWNMTNHADWKLPYGSLLMNGIHLKFIMGVRVHLITISLPCKNTVSQICRFWHLTDFCTWKYYSMFV